MIERVLFRISEYRDCFYGNTMMNRLSDIKQCVSFLWETGFYKEQFNNNFINVSTAYYLNLGNNILKHNTIEEYVSFVEKSLNFETEIINDYLNEYTLKKMINLIETNLIIDRKSDLLNKLFKDEAQKFQLLNTEKITFIAKVYYFFKKVKLDDDLKTTWLGYLNNIANTIYNQYSKQGQARNFFDSMLQLKRNIDLTVMDSFNMDDKFKVAAKEGFTKALNLKPNFAADLLSKYIDLIFEEHDKGEKYVMEKIDEFMIIFKYLDSKDMFETFYIKKLSSRLLYSLTNSKNGEHHLIERLKHECGVVFVNKAEDMINDINLSQDLTLNFKSNSKINSNFYVLSSFSWPVQKIIPGFVSNQIESLHNTFKQSNANRFPGKVLTWHLPYCSADLYFSLKDVTFEVNGIQAAILIKFNKSVMTNGITLKSLLDITQINKDDILPQLNILTNKFKILTLSNNTYFLNSSFVPTKHHMIINNFNDSEDTQVEEIKEVEERNWEDRKHVIDALIMKVMKNKKVFKLDDIIHSVLGMIKFNCEVLIFYLDI